MNLTFGTQCRIPERIDNGCFWKILHAPIIIFAAVAVDFFCQPEKPLFQFPEVH
jgi:hypothetical protein